MRTAFLVVAVLVAASVVVAEDAPETKYYGSVSVSMAFPAKNIEAFRALAHEVGGEVFCPGPGKSSMAGGSISIKIQSQLSPAEMFQRLQGLIAATKDFPEATKFNAFMQLLSEVPR
jgi:hypothetical protein